LTELKPAVFDAVAAEYDTNFTHSRLGRLLRARVWRALADQRALAGCFAAGQHVLELTCGTGEDAVWLAQRGVYVTATDGSAVMTRLTAAKAAGAGVSDYITTHTLSLQAITHPSACSLLPAPFDGVFSNFGGLNTIADLRPLAEALAGLVRPGGRALFVLMGPFCPWEIGWHALHGEWGTAVRRFRRSAPATIGGAVIPVWYPSARHVRQAFAPWFRHRRTESLGLSLPPSYLGHLVERWPGLFGRLARLEQATARLTGGWGDHYIIILERMKDEG
jgi:SAM-dependent methyltransferase